MPVTENKSLTRLIEAAYKIQKKKGDFLDSLSTAPGFVERFCQKWGTKYPSTTDAGGFILALRKMLPTEEFYSFSIGDGNLFSIFVVRGDNRFEEWVTKNYPIAVVATVEAE